MNARRETNEGLIRRLHIGYSCNALGNIVDCCVIVAPTWVSSLIFVETT